MEQKSPLQQMVLGDLDSYVQKNETQSPTYTIQLVIEFHFFAFSCPDLPTPFVEKGNFAPFYAPASFVNY